MRKKAMLLDLIQHYCSGNKAQFARMLDITPQTISTWLTRDTFDADKIFAKCEDVNGDWLLSGEGQMLKYKHSCIGYEAKQETPTSTNPIPLVTEKAAAGFGNNSFAICEDDVKDYYIIPKFRFSNVDFMIEVSGLSMYPHFKSGDIIACTILHDAKFIQWNRCHVIATRNQGILVKRIMPGTQEGSYLIVSDNKEYPPFELPISEITGIALVVGCVSLE